MDKSYFKFWDETFNEILFYISDESISLDNDTKLLSEKDVLINIKSIIPLFDKNDYIIGYDTINKQFVEYNKQSQEKKPCDNIELYVQMLKSKFILPHNLIKTNNANRNVDALISYKQDINVLVNSIGTVIILGSKVEYNWCSITNINDIELNRNILDYINNNENKIFASWNNVLDLLEQNGISKSDFKYFATLKNTNNAFYDLRYAVSDLKRKCIARLCNGEYIKVLKSYIEKIDNTPYNKYSFEFDISPIWKVISAEDYLRFADDKEVAHTYIECYDKIQAMFDKYNEEKMLNH